MLLLVVLTVVYLYFFVFVCVSCDDRVTFRYTGVEDVVDAQNEWERRESKEKSWFI